VHAIDLPGGYSARPTRREDLEAVFRLVADAERHDDGIAEIALSDIAADWDRPDFAAETMSIAVWHADELAATGDVFMGRAEVDVAPEHRGRGLGTALLPWTWRVAKSDGRSSVGQTVSDRRTDAAELFRSHGYEVGHTSWALRIELDDQPPDAPVLPDGLAFRDLRLGEDDRAVFEVIDVAFDEWSDRETQGFENWASSTLHRPEVDPSLVPLIVDGQRIVGVALNFDYGPDEAEGWTQQLAVDRAYRRRGLGRALLQETFRRFHRVGYRRCGLSTDSRTGALGLYEHVGMRVRSSFRRWTKQLDDV
jgi:GNAT superfamily N-acetyltransferase